MKLQPNLLQRRRDKEGRRTPSHLFGGRVRTSTIVLVVAFFALWWTYATYGPQNHPHAPSAPSQVVPPGYVPDPDYTWVPRTRVQQPENTPTRTTTPAPTSSTSPEPTPATTPTSSPGPLPCLLPPPFCPPTPTPSPPGPPSSPTAPGR